MISLRHNRLWLALVLAVAMGVTTGASPAVALACVVPDAPAAAVQAAVQAAEPAVQVCGSMGQSGHCCCGPESAADQPAPAAGHGARHALGQPGCDCAVEAPPVPSPASPKTAAPVFFPGLAVLPAAPVVLLLPSGSTWAFVPAAGSPSAPCRSSGPSRAPPAC
jgi:hypothetical protein